MADSPRDGMVSDATPEMGLTLTQPPSGWRGATNPTEITQGAAPPLADDSSLVRRAPLASAEDHVDASQDELEIRGRKTAGSLSE